VITKNSRTMKKHFSIFLILFAFSTAYGQSSKNSLIHEKISSDSIKFIQIKTDTLFDSRQTISLMILPKKIYDHFSIQFGYSRTELKTTSQFGKRYHSEAAVNGSFFDRDSGGSVTYFEINDTVISRTRNPDSKWAIPDSLINGAIVLMSNDNIKIQPAESDQFYESSKQEVAVLVSGPLLLLHSERMKLPRIEKFVNDRHPRTCLCTTNEAIVFITIDGRSIQAEGMGLFEAQKFLSDIGCVDAINLDGGGSTTMWIRDKGIVNHPSDREGERPVANVLLIMKDDID
jgi:exopolysaccharide biosynthesis protein